MSELIEERKKIIESHNWGWGDVKKKTRWKTFWLQFFFWFTNLFFFGALFFVNFVILNTFFGFSEKFVWQDASLLVAMIISFLTNLSRYHLEQKMFFHYHKLQNNSIDLTQEKNDELKALLKDATKPRSVVTFVMGLLIFFAAIICYFGQSLTWWGYMLIPFVVFESLYLYDLYGYYQDIKKAF